MRCTHFRKRIMPYIEGTLPERLQKLTEEHIAACESCARELAELTQTVHALRQAEYPAMEPALDLRSRIMARLAREPVRRPWFVGRRQAYSGAAVGLLVFAIALAAVWPYLFQVRRPSQSRMPSNVQQPAKGPAAAPKPPPSTKAEPYTVIADGHARDDVDVLSKKLGAAVPRTGASPERFRRIEAPRRTVAPGTPLKNRPGTAPARVSPMPAHKESADRTKPAGAKAVAQATAGIDEAGIEEIPKAEMEGSPTKPHVNGKGGKVGYGGVAEEAGPRPRRAPESRPSGPAGPPPAPGALESAWLERRGTASSEDLSVEAQKQHNLELVQTYERKAKESPNSQVVLEGLLNAYNQAGQPRDEYMTANQLVRLDPKSATYWFAQAQAAERAKMPRTAAASYRQAIGLKIAQPYFRVAKRRLQALEAERGTRP